ncbi:MAG: aminodeoxychorismate lyase [Actinomycetota bacterium]|nr:aminodeoxychorismate lyase [Actinomycetota bacterium]
MSEDRSDEGARPGPIGSQRADRSDEGADGNQRPGAIGSQRADRSDEGADGNQRPGAISSQGEDRSDLPAQVVGVLGLGPVDPELPVLHSDDLGLTRGDGCFEATRLVTDADGRHRIDHLSQHFDRFDHSCAGLDLPPIDRTGWQQLIEQLLAGWQRPGEATLKLMLSRGRESRPAGPVTGIASLTAVSPEVLRQRREGISVITLSRGFASDAFENARWLLGGVKTLSYAVNVAGYREATRRGADDVIFTSSEPYLLEGPTSSLVWLSGNRLITTPLSGTGVLASITQRQLFAAAEQAGFQTDYQLGTAQDLHTASGAWLVSSVRGVARIRSLDGVDLDCRPELSQQLSELAGF